VRTFSRKVDECKPLFPGLYGDVRRAVDALHSQGVLDAENAGALTAAHALLVPGIAAFVAPAGRCRCTGSQVHKFMALQVESRVESAWNSELENKTC